ncbi:MAG: hypothetical protein RMJ56_13370 [Gemmataceae bacterium]|nr:DUF1508 domain-containing protein [Gemmata sp.]MDW8198582.1 hypothetical protein [Gemmataceae bacterium]
MTPFARALVLFVAIAVLMASASLPVAPALQQNKDKKDQPAAVGTIEVYQAKDGWRFRVKSSDGKTLAIATSGQPTKEDCLKIVETLKTTIPQAKVSEIPSEKEKEKDKDKSKEKDKAK